MNPKCSARVDIGDRQFTKVRSCKLAEHHSGFHKDGSFVWGESATGPDPADGVWAVLERHERELGELRGQKAGPCTRNVGNLGVGAPCPDCRHTSLVHPHAGNPGVTHCALCELDAAVKAARIP